MFDNLKTDETIEEQGDSLGGYLLDSDAYRMVIDMAYFDESSGGAASLNFVFKNDKGQQLRQTLWMTSGKAKGQNNYYLDSKGNKQYLPGFSQANNICGLAIGKDVATVAAEAEEKTINLYDYETKKDKPQAKRVAMELIGAEIILGVMRQTVDKNVKQDDGSYKPGGETRDENEVVKAFRAKDGLTAAEIRAEATEAVFLDKWTKKNQGVVLNKAKGAKEGGTTVGSPAASSTGSLFP